MRYILIILVFLPIVGFGQFDNRTEIGWGSISEPQQFLTYDGALANDSIAPFYANYSYDTIGTITFELDSGSTNYVISTYTGMLSIVSTPTYGIDTIKVTITDNGVGGSSETYYGIIWVKDEDSCRFIDPTWGGTESGTRAEPYNSWQSATINTSYTYFQKGGTTAYDYIDISSQEATSWYNATAIGRYGAGVNPILNAVDLGVQAGIYLGEWLGIGSKYVMVHSIELQGADSATGFMVNCANDHYGIFINDCYANEVCDMHKNAGFYLLERRDDDENILRDDTGIKIVNSKSISSARGAHGFKSGVHVDHINCYSDGNSGTGLKLSHHSSAKYCYVTNNHYGGLSIEGDTINLSYNVAYNNFMAGLWTIYDWGRGFRYYVGCSIQNNTLINNDGINIYILSLRNAVIERNYASENDTDGEQYLNREGVRIEQTLNSVIRYNYISNHSQGGIHIRGGLTQGIGGSWDLWTDCENDSIYYNIINEPYTCAFIFEDGDGGNMWFLNNIIYQDSLNETGGNYATVARNNIAEFINCDTEQTNLETTSDTIFVDAPDDFSRNWDANDGTDVTIDYDFNGNAVGDTPEIGAYEYQTPGTTKTATYRGTYSISDYKKRGLSLNPSKRGINYE